MTTLSSNRCGAIQLSTVITPQMIGDSETSAAIGRDFGSRERSPIFLRHAAFGGGFPRSTTVSTAASARPLARASSSSTAAR